jgi:D-proline reductase (dithiol) PrdB
VHLPADARFDIDDPLGDCSYREIPAGATELTWTHAYYRPDRGADLDSVFPLRTVGDPRDRCATGPSGWCATP